GIRLGRKVFRSRRTRLRGRTGSSNTDGQGSGRGAVSGARAVRCGSSARSSHPLRFAFAPTFDQVVGSLQGPSSADDAGGAVRRARATLRVNAVNSVAA